MRGWLGTPRCTLPEIGTGPEGVWVLCGCGWWMSRRQSKRAARRDWHRHVHGVADSVRHQPEEASA